MRLTQWIKAAKRTVSPRERVLPDKQGDLLDISIWHGKLYIAIEEAKGPRVAAGPYTVAEIRKALDELEREEAAMEAGRAMYEAKPDLFLPLAADVYPWELIGEKQRETAQDLARVALDAVSKAGGQA